MELVGEEKKIQALFSEVRFADEQIAPSFAGVWNRAQAKTLRPRSRAFNLSFVAATALLVCALVSLAWWSTRWQRNPEMIAIAPPAPVVTPANIQVDKQTATSPLVRPATFKRKSPAIRLSTLREASLLAANRKAAQDAKAIASWKSPTATLLDSPSDGLLKSLPQMNQTVDEMKSFLPSQPK
jgi:uncharacterized protein YfaS (alpha-2-macroglobulin family)